MPLELDPNKGPSFVVIHIWSSVLRVKYDVVSMGEELWLACECFRWRNSGICVA